MGPYLNWISTYNVKSVIWSKVFAHTSSSPLPPPPPPSSSSSSSQLWNISCLILHDEHPISRKPRHVLFGLVWVFPLQNEGSVMNRPLVHSTRWSSTQHVFLSLIYCNRLVNDSIAGKPHLFQPGKVIFLHLKNKYKKIVDFFQPAMLVYRRVSKIPPTKLPISIFFSWLPEVKFRIFLTSQLAWENKSGTGKLRTAIRRSTKLMVFT